MAGEDIVPDEDGQLVIRTPLLATLDALRTEQAAGFARVETAMRGKADKADVSRMEARLDAHGAAIAALETWRHDKEVASRVHADRDRRQWTVRQKVGAVCGVVAVVAATVLGPILAAHIH